MPKANDMIAQVLVEAGIEYVFGIPGGGTGQIYQSLFDHQDKIQTILVRHEQTAAIMADAYGRVTGKPAVIMGQGVFMGSNAAFGIMEASLSSSPMVVLTDTSDGNMAQRPANQSGAGEYGSIDLLNIFRSMTKYATLAAHPKEAVMGTQLAIKHATTGRPGPTCVLMRSSAIAGEVNLEQPPFIHHTSGYLNTGAPVAPPEDVEKAAKLLAEARNPVLVVGHGARMSGAEEQVLELAEMLGMPVATTYKGKSVIEETHPLALGMVGVYGLKAANTVVGEADVILAVGAKLTPQDTVRENPQVFNPHRQKLIQIDIEALNAGWALPVELGMVGDAKAVLSQVLEALRPLAGSKAKQAEQRRKNLQAAKSAAEYYADDPALTKDSAPATPQRTVRLIQETVDPSTMFTLDAGNNRVWMAHMYQSQQRNTFFVPGGIAGMGWALPAALAVKLVHRDRPVIAVSGDGGFMMTVHALSTAIQYDLPVVGVVFNDSALGMVRHHQPGRIISSEFANTDFAAIAKGFGAYGVRVKDSRDLPDAIREAQASKRPAVVDVLIDPKPSPDDIRANVRGITET